MNEEIRARRDAQARRLAQSVAASKGIVWGDLSEAQQRRYEQSIINVFRK